MKLTFRYDPTREFDNFRVSFKSKNHRSASTRQKLFFQRYRRLTLANAQAFSRAYLREQGLRPSVLLQDIRRRWQQVERRFFARADRIYGQPLPVKRLTVYLTVHDRCSYNFERGYFFIHTNPRQVTKTIMHELWHWYFYFSVGRAIKQLYGPIVFNDIKESLTVLLNEEFADLMPGAEDRGYPQHKRLRAKIKRSYRTTHDIYQTIRRSLPS